MTGFGKTTLSLIAMIALLAGCNSEPANTATSEAPATEQSEPEIVEEQQETAAPEPTGESTIAAGETAEAKVEPKEEGSAAAQPTAEASEPSGETSIAADNPDAVLSAPATLSADTIEAAQHDRTISKIPYIGAWAGDAGGCALIDQGVYDGFAVITPTQVRTFEEICTISAGPMTSNPIRLDASCQAEGETFQSVMEIEIGRGQEIKLRHEGTSGFDLIRCNLPRQ